jgi:hypothetical protein
MIAGAIHGAAANVLMAKFLSADSGFAKNFAKQKNTAQPSLAFASRFWELSL